MSSALAPAEGLADYGSNTIERHQQVSGPFSLSQFSVAYSC
jgi:hypothetical protein